MVGSFKLLEQFSDIVIISTGLARNLEGCHHKWLSGEWLFRSDEAQFQQPIDRSFERIAGKADFALDHLGNVFVD